jgi:DNA polymerase-2
VAQLEAAGKATMKPGQRVRFLYTRGEPGVWAWDLPGKPNPGSVDVARYEQLLLRAASAVTEPLGVDENQLRTWVSDQATQSRFHFAQTGRRPAGGPVPTARASD